MSISSDPISVLFTYWQTPVVFHFSDNPGCPTNASVITGIKGFHKWIPGTVDHSHFTVGATPPQPPMAMGLVPGEKQHQGVQQRTDTWNISLFKLRCSRSCTVKFVHSELQLHVDFLNSETANTIFVQIQGFPPSLTFQGLLSGGRLP